MAAAAATAAAAAGARAGLRAGLQAGLQVGAAVLIVDAGQSPAPAVRQLAGLILSWVTVAVTGAVLLAAGAMYQARLRDLGKLRAPPAGGC